ncbi:hypothetical protein E4630_11480 [Aeromonas hydrophila]|uniref:hypothetical protein n=1 Tax=Aeromonas hydrophila TaxID=644 RepID=UPI00107EA84E|nr:hypothetical protein [Aeromonas hydrophila]QBX71432.1 hypothetical protein E4625_11700 [Aeromonas hydrophila]QBX76132.1 hypothetical protein E4630_11480 [Aeromonas hydrophila]
MQGTNDAEGSNEVERLYRRNTLFVSSIISVYSTAGGKLSGEASVGFAKVNFSNPDILEYSLIVVVLYFCWRHWLVSKNIRREMLQRVYSSIIEPKWIWEALKDEIELLRKQLPWPTERGEGIPPHIVGKELSHVGLVIVRYEISFKDTKLVVNSKTLSVSLFRHPVVFFVMRAKYRLTWVKKAISNTNFGDGVLPLLLTVMAILLYGFNRFKLFI